MAFKLKTKIALGGSFLFILLVLVAALGVYYFNRIARESREIVKDNYETLNYAREMLKEIETLKGVNSTEAFRAFESNLSMQEKNITETGEKNLTVDLRYAFNTLKKNGYSDTLAAHIRNTISGIMLLNLQAIDRKNQAARKSAENGKTIITVILTLCILIGLTFIFNFPSLVAGPVAKLTGGIRAIANKQYSERIHLNRKDEFGQLADAFNQMAEKLDEYEHSNLARVLFEKKRAETVIHSLKDASIGIDKDGQVLFANQQALQLLSLKEHEIVGQAAAVVQGKNDLFRFLLEEKNNAPFKIVVEGRENYFVRERFDIRQDDTKAGTVIVLKNITSFKELDVAKTNFIATISHELKTPLASSDFSLKLLEDARVGTLTNEQKELVTQLRTDNQRMLRILSELLNMSQVEAGKIQLDIQAVQPEIIVQNSIAALAAAAKEKEIILTPGVEMDLPPVTTDADKLGWVLNNFLSNAIRYSPHGGTITVAVHRAAANLRFSVKDEGPGIEENYQSRIFERYFQVPGRSDKKGSGIGLAISKEFIEALGGKIWVESSPGRGSIFGFDLPINTPLAV